jgi:organic radical activating enzyme
VAKTLDALVGLFRSVLRRTPPVPRQQYLSCHHIERGLVFYPSRATACCANPATGSTPTLAPFNAELTADQILAGRAEIIRRHKAGDIVPECQGCPRLVEGEWETRSNLGRYPIDEVTIAHFTTCNIRCNYCYTVTRPELSAPLSKAPRLLKTFEQLIAEGKLAPYATIRFSGGEPTLLPEFEPLLTLLTNHGVRSHVYTNAVKLSDAILNALHLDKVELILGIDAAYAATYKAIKKMNYNETVWNNVATYCATQRPEAVAKIWAKFIFCGENYSEATAFVERAAVSGVKHVYYDFDASRARPGMDRDGLGILPDEVADQVAALRHRCAIHGIEADFAQAGLAWLTPEREARADAEFLRLQSEPNTSLVTA